MLFLDILIPGWTKQHDVKYKKGWEAGEPDEASFGLFTDVNSTLLRSNCSVSEIMWVWHDTRDHRWRQVPPPQNTTSSTKLLTRTWNYTEDAEEEQQQTSWAQPAGSRCRRPKHTGKSADSEPSHGAGQSRAPISLFTGAGGQIIKTVTPAPTAPSLGLRHGWTLCGFTLVLILNIKNPEL